MPILNGHRNDAGGYTAEAGTGPNPRAGQTAAVLAQQRVVSAERNPWTASTTTTDRSR